MKINYKKINKYLIIGFIVLIIVIGLLLYYFKSNKNKQIEIFTDTQEKKKLVMPGWNQIGEDIIGKESGDESGTSVSLSSDGTIVAIGAPYNDNDNGSDSGHVRVYQYKNSSWNQLGEDIIGKKSGDESGTSVSLSSDGKIVAIGAPKNDGDNDNNQYNSGHVRVYQYDETDNEWIQLGEDIDSKKLRDYSGISVSLSSDGKIVAIGAHGNDDNDINSGHVRVYQYDETNNKWIQLGENIIGKAKWDESGTSVSLSSDGKIVAIGAPKNGRVRVYQYRTVTEDEWNNDTIVIAKNTEETYYENTEYWVQLGEDIIGKAIPDWSGYSVSLSSDGTIVAIGAPDNDNVNGSDSGHVRVYQYNDSQWNQLGEDINGKKSGDESGTSVSLSSDGKIVAIGAPDNDNVNGSDSGHVRVYQYRTVTEDEWNNDTIVIAKNTEETYNKNTKYWIRLGQDIDGEVDWDESGTSVSLSSDGKIVAIGAPDNNDNGSDSGNARVYQYITENELTKIKLTDDSKPIYIYIVGELIFNKIFDTNITKENIKEVIIGSKVTSIYMNAFINSSLTSITIPNSVTSIDISAFGNCTNLTSITIPNSVTSIGIGAFMNCTSLTSITFSNNGTEIKEILLGEQVFDNIPVLYDSEANTLNDLIEPDNDSEYKNLKYKLNIPSGGVTFTYKPSTTQPSTTQPSTTQPSTTQPSTTQPSTTQPSTTQPSTAQPKLYVSPMEEKGYNGKSVYISNMDGITSTFLPSIEL